MLLDKLRQFFLLPITLFAKDDTAKKYGVNTLTEIRNKEVLKLCKGKLLDIGCGKNILVREYGNGVGQDIHPWPGVDYVCPVAQLNLPAESFDTITIVAALNHIADRDAALDKIYSLLKPNGQLIITMIHPIIGHFAHRYSYDFDHEGRGHFGHDEKMGMTKKEILTLMQQHNFKLVFHKKFFYFLNNVYVFEKV